MGSRSGSTSCLTTICAIRSLTVGTPQNPFASALLWNGDSTDRWRKVGSRAHPVPDLVEITLQAGFELLNRLTIHAGRTLAGFDRFVRLVHAPLLDHEGLVCHIRRRHPVSSLFQ